MKQLLLLPDPRPLVDRLGPEFFRQAPERPGVYLMRDAADAVLYVGKAKNLRKRLAHYRVANPDRLPRRQLRMLRAVVRIELHECPDESSALAREAALLRELRPRFNRAGTWVGASRYLAGRVTDVGLDLAITPAAETGWLCRGPLGGGAVPLRRALVRLCWCAVHDDLGLARLPVTWFQGRLGAIVTIPRYAAAPAVWLEAEARLRSLFAGQPEEYLTWIRERTSKQVHPFETKTREADMETIAQWG